MNTAERDRERGRRIVWGGQLQFRLRLCHHIAGAGFEPATALEHGGDTGGTDQVHPAELQRVSCRNRGQIGTPEGHPGDVSDDAPCCAYVAHSDLPGDLSRLAEIWEKLPEATRAAILTLAEGARKA